jgi:hypothetical protein
MGASSLGLADMMRSSRNPWHRENWHCDYENGEGSTLHGVSLRIIFVTRFYSFHFALFFFLYFLLSRPSMTGWARRAQDRQRGSELLQQDQNWITNCFSDVHCQGRQERFFKPQRLVGLAYLNFRAQSCSCAPLNAQMKES